MSIKFEIYIKAINYDENKYENTLAIEQIKI